MRAVVTQYAGTRELVDVPEPAEPGPEEEETWLVWWKARPVW